MSTRSSLAHALTVALVALPALAACQPGAPTPVAADGLGVTTLPIVNGAEETGWPGVVALTIEFNGHYSGSFCSGTLIAPSWVMTAGHCVTGPEIEQQGIKPSNGIDQDCDGTPDDGCVTDPVPVDGVTAKKSTGCAGGGDATGLLMLGAALLLLLRRRRWALG